VGEACDDGAQAFPKRGEAQAAELVGDELEIPEADGFTKGKTLNSECLLPMVAMNSNDGTIKMV
jgi:hypothetical protein